MRRRELLSAGAVLVAGVAGCAAEPIEGQNESEAQEDGSAEEVGEEAADDEGGENESSADGDSDGPGTAGSNDSGSDGPEGANETGGTNGSGTDGENRTNETDEMDETDVANDTVGDVADGNGTDGPPSGDDPMVDDEGDGDDGEEDEAFDADETVERDLEALTIGVVGPSGELIAGASITGERASNGTEFEGETGDGGTYTVEIPEGIYTIEVDHPAYEARTVEYAHEGEREVGIELEAGEGTPAVSGLRLVVTDTDGERIEGASVRGEGEPVEAEVPLAFSGETDADGEYEDRLYETEYVIDLDHPDYQARTIEYDHDGPTELTVELGPA